MYRLNEGFLEDKEEEPQSLDLNVIRETLSLNGYTYLRPVGKGGFSSVFLVFSNQYGLEFVVKVSNYRGSRKKQAQGSDEFDQTEINHLINLNHPNIIDMYKYFTDDHYLYIILEYCQGGSLKDLIEKNGRIRSCNLYNYCHQIITALKHCHDLQIAHNDIKPANVLIDKNQRLKLADFGLSKGFSPNLIYPNTNNRSNMTDHSIGKNGQILIKKFGGSKPYMAPELLNHSAYDPFKADIWSLGVTFYELATGHLPRKTTDFSQMHLQISVGIFSFDNIKLPSPFCQAIHKMLDVNPLKRPNIDWLLEQPIFAPETSGNTKLRSSIINRSSSIGSLSKLRIRPVSSFSSDNDIKPSDSSPIVSQSNLLSDAILNDNQAPFSPLKPTDDQVFEHNPNKNDFHQAGTELAAVRRKKIRRNIKMMSSSLPPSKTFL